jgi:iron-sulfur cluster assembly protein
MTEENKIHRGMTIDSILSLFPQKAQKLSQVITNAGLHCIGCHAATWETLEAGMYTHGKTDKEIDTLVDQLNALLEEQVDHTTITISARAAKKYLSILQEEGKAGWGLRFSEKMSGCNGFEYVLDYSEKPEPNDEIFTSQGIEIHIDKTMRMRLLGSEIDYVDGLQGSGFKITNPNVRSSCGCGTSHGY